MALDFKKDEKFEDFGSLEEYFKNYGDCTVSIEDIEEPNIKLIIISNQEIEFRLLCSIPLSNIIRQKGGFPEEMDGYRVLRIKKNDVESYFRVSQSIDIDLNQLDSEIEKLDKTLIGNKRFVFKIENM